jgi:hypothetical protein
MPRDPEATTPSWRPPPEGAAARVAVGLHRVEREVAREAEPGGRHAAPASHLDFFLGPPPPCDDEARAVWSWRLPLEAFRDGRIVAGAFEARATPPHRAIYLRLDALRELGPGRGTFTPLLRVAATASRGRCLRVETQSWILDAEPWDEPADGASSDRWRFVFREKRA